MRETSFNIRTHFLYALIAVLILLPAGCTVKYVADYDSSIKDNIISASKEVDLFWGNMLDTPPNERQYVEFKDRYNAIETDLRELVMKNEIRPLNEQSTAQSKIALTLWEGDQKKHRINDGFSDYLAEAHREQYLKIFTAMAKGEAIKEK